MSDPFEIATPPLDEFLQLYNEDDNIWWTIGCGHHMDLFEAAVEKLDELRDLIAAYRKVSPSPNMTVYLRDFERLLDPSLPPVKDADDREVWPSVAASEEVSP